VAGRARAFGARRRWRGCRPRRASLGLLGLALKSLPLGTAYAIWTRVGTIGTAILGIVLFGESTDALRLACIGLIVAGIVGLKLVSAH
jgi:quaternary ammonium compound-resistance protein SugE